MSSSYFINISIEVQSHIRVLRDKMVTRYGPSLQTDLPPKKQVLLENKQQLIRLIVEDLEMNPTLQTTNKLIVTGINPDEAPFEVYQNTVTRLDNLKNSQEEADVIIIHHLLNATTSSNEKPSITVVCDDTDVFLLLVHFCKLKGLTNEVYPEET